MTEFNPILPLSVGMLIGLSAAAVFFLGRILGISEPVAHTQILILSGARGGFFLIGLVG